MAEGKKSRSRSRQEVNSELGRDAGERTSLEGCQLIATIRNTAREKIDFLKGKEKVKKESEVTQECFYVVRWWSEDRTVKRHVIQLWPYEAVALVNAILENVDVPSGLVVKAKLSLGGEGGS